MVAGNISDSAGGEITTAVNSQQGESIQPTHERPPFKGPTDRKNERVESLPEV